jgi:hypothetical protein
MTWKENVGPKSMEQWHKIFVLSIQVNKHFEINDALLVLQTKYEKLFFCCVHGEEYISWKTICMACHCWI